MEPEAANVVTNEEHIIGTVTAAESTIAVVLDKNLDLICFHPFLCDPAGTDQKAHNYENISSKHS